MSLAPEIKAFIDSQVASGAPAVWEAPVSQLRANTQGRVATSGPVEPVHSIENRFIPGPTSDLPLRIYRPTKNSATPAILYFHGGGFVLNNLDFYDASLTRLANQSGMTIIAVNYQKAPEHPFPIPFDDCYSTLLWVREHATDLDINREAIGVAGDSAGGNLASAVAIKARDNKISLAFQLLVYPCNGRDFTTDSYRNLATGYGLTRQAMEWFWDQYLQGSDHDQNPYAIPMVETDFSNLAPAVIITAEYDPLLSDGQCYARHLEDSGVLVHYRQFDGMNHGFFTNLGVTPTAKVAIDYAAELLKEMMG